MAFVVVPEYFDTEQEAFVVNTLSEAQESRKYLMSYVGRSFNILPVRHLPVAFRVKRLYEEIKQNEPPFASIRIALEKKFGDIL